MPATIKNIWVCTLALFVSYSMCYEAMAQTAGQLQRRGDASFANGDYYSAIQIYSAILYDSPLVKNTSAIVYPFRPAGHLAGKIRPTQKSYLQYHLAESYRLCYHYKEAATQYEQYLLSQDTKFPLARLWYGLCLLSDDQPDKAISSFNMFLQKYRTVDSFTQKAKQGIANSNFALLQKSTRPVATVSKLLPTLSADGSNFALGKINDTEYLFTTSRHEFDKKKEKIYPVRLYSGSLKEPTIKKIAGFPAVDMNMATPSLSSDGLTLYFTGWKENGTQKNTYYRVYYSTRTSVNAQWSEPVVMPSPVNMDGFHSKQPFITKDNKYLFFVSDRTGGLGKYDIWMITMEAGKPIGHAINAGNHVNTAGEEASPFYDAVSGNLYFSSNGRTGMGGMDIYKIKQDSLSGQWAATAVNLGAPFNSVKDDDYYSKDSNTDTAYLSSDRFSTCCMEIFKVVPVLQRDTVIKYVQAKELKKNVDTLYVAKDDNKRLMDSVNAITVDRMYINYRFASIKIRKEDFAQLNRIVQMLKKDTKLNILVASFADCIGSESANIKISRKRSESVKAYLIENGVAESRINIDFFGKKHFVLACKEDSSYHTENQMANRRSDLVLTTEIKPKWQPSGLELDIEKGSTVYPKMPLHTVSVEEPTKLRTDNKETMPTDGNLAGSKLTGIKSTAGITNISKGGDKMNSGILTKENSIAKNNQSNKNKSLEINAIADNNDKTARPGSRSKYFIEKKEAVSTGKKAGEPGFVNKKKPVAGKNDQVMTTVNNAKAIPEPYLNQSVPTSADSASATLKINELLDPTPRLKKPTLIEQMTSRTPKKSFEVFSVSDSVKVELYDNGVFDFDTVSVIYNKALVVYKEMLRTNKPISFYVKLNTDPKKNEMIFFAENLGLTPPNSALMIITDGDKKRTEINVSSDLDHNSVIYFIKVNRNKQVKN